ncbi:MAG: Hint domain-containing protein, partial [Roseovarius sp.]
TLWGDPFALLPGVALEAAPGVARVMPEPGAEVVVLHFESEQVIFAENGLMALCPASCNLLDYAQERAGPRYEVLSLTEARGLVLAMARMNGLTAAPRDVAQSDPWVQA